MEGGVPGKAELKRQKVEYEKCAKIVSFFET
jgi:hypothetical protein